MHVNGGVLTVYCDVSVMFSECDAMKREITTSDNKLQSEIYELKSSTINMEYEITALWSM